MPLDRSERSIVTTRRLSRGTWSDALHRTIDEGDIAASYSGDTIGLQGRIRRSFHFDRLRWVCTSITTIDGAAAACAYRLVEPQDFDGDPITFDQKTLDCEAARNDPNGFYHGVLVTHRGTTFVLAGPPQQFIGSDCDPCKGSDQQLGLFGP